MKLRNLALAGLLLLPACDGCFGSTGPQDIKCWSGGVVTFEGRSLDTVYAHSGRYISFRDSQTGLLTNVSGDCRVADSP